MVIGVKTIHLNIRRIVLCANSDWDRIDATTYEGISTKSHMGLTISGWVKSTKKKEVRRNKRIVIPIASKLGFKSLGINLTVTPPRLIFYQWRF